MMQVKGHKEDVERYLGDRGLSDFYREHYDIGATGNKRYYLDNNKYVRDILDNETREEMKRYNIGVVVSIKEDK